MGTFFVLIYSIVARPGGRVVFNNCEFLSVITDNCLLTLHT